MNSELQRLYKLNGQHDVVVTIHSAVQEAGDNGDWSCTYSVVGLGHSKQRQSIGVDGMQALYLAMIYIATDLYNSVEYQRGNLTWLGNFDLGLPVAEIMRDYVDETRAALNKQFDEPQ